MKIAKIRFAKNANENSCKCIPCTVHIMLILIFFIINVGGIITYYLYSQWYLKKDSPHVDFNTKKETTIW